MRHRCILGLIASLVALTACSTPGGPPAQSPPAPAPSVVTTLAPREGVTYPESGVYAAEETSVAVGILRYRAQDETDGVWMLVARGENTVRAADAEPFAVLLGQTGFDSELGPLDGQYVAVEGAATKRDAAPAEIDVTGLSRVSDIFPTKSNAFSKPGVYTLWDGSTFLLGWAGDTVDGTTDVYDIEPDGPGTPTLIARVTPSGKGPPRGQMLHADGLVVSDDPVPLVRAPMGGGYGPQGVGPIVIGLPAQWRDAEQAGIKDLRGGRHRVVGAFRVTHASETVIERYSIKEPSYLRPPVNGWTVTLEDPDGLIERSGAIDGVSYVAAVGVLSANSKSLHVEEVDVIGFR